jgi:hypothetical protein
MITAPVSYYPREDRMLLYCNIVVEIDNMVVSVSKCYENRLARQ